MAGSYSGTLYSYVETNAPYRGPSPDQQVKQFKIDRNGSINGEFNILSPWEDDDRMNEGIDFQSGRFDATGFGFFHMDIWTGEVCFSVLPVRVIMQSETVQWAG